jgi:light-regulated signal transduction histidine kinase (bacteriophytochrome)
MTFINKATSRMQTLIKDLQDYSRIGKEKEKTPVDCNILLKDVLYEMEPAISESNASIRLDNLPIIKGYYLGIKCLFQNLISNAIKFRKKGTFPIINIGVIIKSNEWLFTIKDNGIGIDKKYYKKLFVIFQRLHNKEEYQGTGIGLAQTKKIIDLHGGRIWIESETGTGCTFNFTIPKYQNT